MAQDGHIQLEETIAVAALTHAGSKGMDVYVRDQHGL
jgi:hypothetical protein